MKTVLGHLFDLAGADRWVDKDFKSLLLRQRPCMINVQGFFIAFAYYILWLRVTNGNICDLLVFALISQIIFFCIQLSRSVYNIPVFFRGLSSLGFPWRLVWARYCVCLFLYLRIVRIGVSVQLCCWPSHNSMTLIIAYIRRVSHLIWPLIALKH